jgi:hypothetical protein
MIGPETRKNRSVCVGISWPVSKPFAEPKGGQGLSRAQMQGRSALARCDVASVIHHQSAGNGWERKRNLQRTPDMTEMLRNTAEF